MDRGAWRATVHRVTKSQTRLKQLSMHTSKLFNGASLVAQTVTELLKSPKILVTAGL